MPDSETPKRGRPSDPGRRDRVLDAAVDHVMAHGLDGFSLRPLAAALDTSPRMLLYDFGSADELLLAVTNEARRRLAGMVRAELAANPNPAAAVATMWRWFTAPEHRGYAAFALQVQHATYAGRLPREGVELALLPVFAEVGAPPEDHALVMTVFFGLLERYLAGDEGLADRTMARFGLLLRTE